MPIISKNANIFSPIVTSKSGQLILIKEVLTMYSKRRLGLTGCISLVSDGKRPVNRNAGEVWETGKMIRILMVLTGRKS
jgi:hypothetical protein